MARDILYVRGGEPVAVELQRAGAEQVSWRTDQGEQQLPSWQVAHISLGDAPPALAAAHEALSDGQLREALRGFEQVAQADGRSQAWAAFHAANTRRLQAELTALAGDASALRAAADALAGWLDAHPDHYLRPAALMALARSLPAEEALPRWAELGQGFGPIWALHGELGQLRLRALAGEDVWAAWDDLERRATEAEFGLEVAHFAAAHRVDVLRQLGRHDDALAAIPTATVDGQETNAAYSQAWLESPATPLLLNAIGEAVVGLSDDPAGRAAAAPLHKRVVRYFPDMHVEHARALRALVAGCAALGRPDYGTEFAGLLATRYPEAPAASRSRALPGALGEDR